MQRHVISTVLVPATAPANNQAAYDLVLLSAIKAELDLTGTKLDELVLSWITQASAAAAKFCDRVFPVETVQDQIFPARDYYPAPVAIGGEDPLQLSRWPIAGTQQQSNNSTTISPAAPSTAGTAPPVAPTLSAVAGGALAATSYYGKITYVTPTGETAASAESILAVAANNLPVVASPAADTQNIATGWNVYLGSKSFGETKQNISPLPLGTAFTLPAAGLVNGAALPPYILVIENNQPIAEGVDFITKFDVAQLIRLDGFGRPRRWSALPLVVQFPAGYYLADPTLADAQDAVTRMVKGRYFGRKRDPALRSENILGAYEAQFWFASGPGAAVGNLTPDVEALLEKYRTPVFG
jgi:hypothetical protein